MKLKDTWMGEVHEGFYEEYEAVIGTIHSTLKYKLYMKHNIVLTGHSLGAALAVLVMYDLNPNYTLTRLDCYPIALPHVGTLGFKVNYVRRNCQDCTFPIANIYDAVPYLPASFGYVELMHAIKVNFQHWELVHNHSIEHYVQAIKDLPDQVEVGTD
jgi:predicted lipase